MTLKGRNAGGTSGDAERDVRLDRLYREAGGEMPPTRLDAAILAAAHREVGARPRPLSSMLRRWRVPVSIAAVVVLSVSLVTLVQEEGGDRLTGIPPLAAPQALEQEATPPVPAAMAGAGREDRYAQRQSERLTAPPASTPAPAAPSRPTAPVEDQPAAMDAAVGPAPEPFLRRRQVQQPQAAAVAPQPQAGAPAIPDLLAKPAPAPSAHARDEATAGGRSMVMESPFSPEARRPAPQAPASPSSEKDAVAGTAGRVMSSAPTAPASSASTPVPGAVPQAAVPDQGRALEPGGANLPQMPPIWSDLERQPPAKWLERIEELRQAGRNAELNDLLAEFRKRFPAHPLPAWVR